VLGLSVLTALGLTKLAVAGELLCSLGHSARALARRLLQHPAHALGGCVIAGPGIGGAVKELWKKKE
jgi:hypothetical protein